MKKIIFIAITVMMMFSQVTKADEISRLQIQNFFHKIPGNASYTTAWEHQYLNKKVNWQGSIFSIQYQKDFDRTEVTMKILPGTLMYDTVVYVPGDITGNFKIRDEVPFTATIVKGIDMFGVQEVELKVGRNLDDQFGDYVFSNDGTVNVNFFKKKDISEE